jgi:hypothetical protein
MMQNKRLDKTATKMLLVGTVLSAIPLVAAWFVSNRLPSVVTEEQRISILDDTTDRNPPSDGRKQLLLKLEQEQRTIDNELKRSVTPSTTYVDMRARWQVIHNSMLRVGASPQEADTVIEAARRHLPTKSYGWPRPHWPVFIERGQVDNKPVWIVACAWPKAANAKLGINTLAPEELKWEYWLVAVDANTDQVIARFSSIL